MKRRSSFLTILTLILAGILVFPTDYADAKKSNTARKSSSKIRLLDLSLFLIKIRLSAITSLNPSLAPKRFDGSHKLSVGVLFGGKFK